MTSCVYWNETQKTINWLKQNQTTVSSKSFQAILISKNRNALPGSLTTQINNTEIAPQSSVDLLGVTISSELKCQINAILRLKNYFNFEQKKVLIERFIYEKVN